jgi:FlaA1/EpsC-like NDP-sugar epimerase
MNDLLGRHELEFDLPDLRGQQILVTGSEGYIGSIVCAQITLCGGIPVRFDLPVYDILGAELHQIAKDCDGLIHLAADKYASNGEDFPKNVATLNIDGTYQVTKAILGKPFVFASTCKAAGPCTVYGASKLIGERIVLNAGGTVVRLVNVVNSTGSVLQIWDEFEDSIPVTNCYRMWMTPLEAASSLIFALTLEPGRYAPNVPPAEHIEALANRALPGRPQHQIPLRRGDRPRERLISEYEEYGPQIGNLNRVYDLWEPKEQSPWDSPDPYRAEGPLPALTETAPL